MSNFTQYLKNINITPNPAEKKKTGIMKYYFNVYIIFLE